MRDDILEHSSRLSSCVFESFATFLSSKEKHADTESQCQDKAGAKPKWSAFACGLHLHVLEEIFLVTASCIGNQV